MKKAFFIFISLLIFLTLSAWFVLRWGNSIDVSESQRIDKKDAKTNTRINRPTSQEQVIESGTAHRIYEEPSLDEQWELIINSGASKDEINYRLQSFVKAISKEGNTRYAFQKVVSTFGEETYRNVLLSLIFSSSSSKYGELVALRGELNDRNEIEAVNGGLSARILNTSDKNQILGYLRNFKDDYQIIMNGLRLRVDSSCSRDDSVKEMNFFINALVTSDHEQPYNKQILRDYLNLTARRLPFETWEKVSSGIGFELDDQSMGLLVSSMIRDDSEKAFKEFVKGKSEGHVTTSYLGWLEFDAVAAKKWLTENIHEQPKGVSDSVYAACCEYAIKKNDIDEYSRLRNMVEDERKLKELDAIYVVNRQEFLYKQIDENPSATINDILHGWTDFPAESLEKAMGAWLNKDFNAAESWYQQNWKSLPSEKAQYVAAAFANQAVTQGDTHTATQWLGYVKDVNVKQRIQESIDKANTQQ